MSSPPAASPSHPVCHVATVACSSGWSASNFEASGSPATTGSIGLYARALEKDPGSPAPRERDSGRAWPPTLEGRLFLWLLVVALVPTLLVVAVGLGAGARSLEWLGTLGPWARVAESGRTLLDAAESPARTDPALRSALERHRAELSASLVQAQRWSFIGERLAATAPAAIVAVVLILSGLALLVSRRLARELARPIHDLVGWSGRMAEGRPLPESNGRERREVVEVRALRAALRTAAARITESRRRELEAERLRAWGEMARRVAHEMKNPLTPLRLAAHRLAAAPAGDLSDVREVIEEETARLEELAKQFAALGRPAAGPASEVDVSELLGGLLASDVPPSIRSSLRVEPGTSPIRAYYDALLRAFRNLVRNAVEATAARGEDARIELAVGPSGGGVEVVVADNGAGIPDALLERIFEPDFTRKPGGTGLGLAVVRQTVLAHGGRVSARPRPGGGAEFIVQLPGAPDASTNGVP
jgi:signal transduction histidine kinase